MAKATVNLPNGGVATLDGTPEEIATMIARLAVKDGTTGGGGPRSGKKRKARKSGAGGSGGRAASPAAEKPDLAAIVNLIKTCDEAEAIEKNILDRTGRVDRVLLPLYVVHEHFDGKDALTTGEIAKITSDLGVPIHISNVSTILSGTASKYVMGDKVRTPGVAVRYKLSRRGLAYMKGVISGKPDGG